MTKFVAELINEKTSIIKIRYIMIGNLKCRISEQENSEVVGRHGEDIINNSE